MQAFCNCFNPWAHTYESIQLILSDYAICGHYTGVSTSRLLHLMMSKLKLINQTSPILLVEYTFNMASKVKKKSYVLFTNCESIVHWCSNGTIFFLTVNVYNGIIYIVCFCGKSVAQMAHCRGNTVCMLILLAMHILYLLLKYVHVTQCRMFFFFNLCSLSTYSFYKHSTLQNLLPAIL